MIIVMFVVLASVMVGLIFLFKHMIKHAKNADEKDLADFRNKMVQLNNDQLLLMAYKDNENLTNEEIEVIIKELKNRNVSNSEIINHQPTLQKIHKEEQIEDYKKAENRIFGASLWGYVLSAITLVVSIITAQWQTGIITAGIIAGLSTGIWFKSRICAILLFVIYAIDKTYSLLNGSNPNAIGIGLYLFLIPFFTGIIGTFTWHKRYKEKTNTLNQVQGNKTVIEERAEEYEG